MSLLSGVDLRHLAALRAVAETGSFGRAATRLGFTQSAVSQQIATLERALGAPVFDRPGGPRPVELTPLGRVLARHADAILRQVDVAADELAAVIAGRSSRLLIGSYQSVSVRILPTVLGRLRAEQPGVELRVVEDDDKDVLLDLVLQGELDLTFTVDAIDDRHFEVISLMDDDFVVLSPADADGNADTVELQRLAGMPLIGQNPSTCQAQIDNGLLANGIEPRYVFRSNDNTAVQAMVRAGMGHAVLPRLCIDPGDPGVLVRSPSPRLPDRAIGLALARGRTRPAALERFVELTREACADALAPAGAAA